MRLLVVDDDAAITTLLVALFSRHGFVIDTATNGEEAVEKLRSTEFSAILLDLMLPRMNGFEVIREMKSFAPALLERTIVVTAASEATLRHFDQSDVVALIRKPFDLEELVGAVQRCAVEDPPAAFRLDDQSGGRPLRANAK